MSNTSVYGLYRDRAAIEEAIDALKQGGFRNADISVLYPHNQGSKDFAINKETKAPEGAVTGEVSGAVIGGALGWLMGAGLVAIPGIDPSFIAAGPIMSVLAGIGAGGAVGTLVGALAGLGMPEYEAKRYEGRIKEGGILLSVHCDSSEWVKRAETLLKNTGADDIASAGEAHADFLVTEKPAQRPITHV
jgi:hypothetical protein